MKQGFMITPEDGTYKIKFEGDDLPTCLRVTPSLLKNPLW